MKRQSYAQLTSNISLTEAILWKVILEISSQIFDFGFNRTTIQILDNQVWNRQICHSPVGFGRMRLLEITSRKCHIHRNCVDLIMESRIDNSEEQVTLCLTAI